MSKKIFKKSLLMDSDNKLFEYIKDSNEPVALGLIDVDSEEKFARVIIDQEEYFNLLALKERMLSLQGKELSSKEHSPDQMSKDIKEICRKASEDRQNHPKNKINGISVRQD
jgi:hypothetical protein